MQGLKEEIRLLREAICPNPLGYAITIPAIVTARLDDALGKNRPERVEDITDIPLREGFDAVVYWFTKVKITLIIFMLIEHDPNNLP